MIFRAGCFLLVGCAFGLGQTQAPLTQNIYRVPSNQAYYGALKTLPSCPSDDMDGVVTMNVVVGENGKVALQQFITGDATLAKELEPKIADWSWVPLQIDGKHASFTFYLSLSFNHSKGNCEVSPTFYFVDPRRWIDSPRLAPGKITQLPGNAAVGLLIKKMQPVYPAAAKANHIGGKVALSGVIGKEGKIIQLRVVEGDPTLVPNSIEAIRQWEYRPFMVDGRPIDIETTIQINYTMN
jgi:TonB family protein